MKLLGTTALTAALMTAAVMSINELPGLNESIVTLILFDACFPQSFSET